MWTIEIIASLTGLVAGLLAGLVWAAVSSRLRTHAFWSQLQATAQSLLSTSDSRQFLNNYLKLLPELFKYLGQIFLIVLLATIPVIGGYWLISPWAEGVWRGHVTHLFVQSSAPITLRTRGLDFEAAAGRANISIDSSLLDQPAELITPSGTFHCPDLSIKQAHATSLLKWLLLSSLMFEELHPAGELPSRQLPSVLLRLSSGDNNVCWPYLSDWEFDYLVLVCVGSVLSLFIPHRKASARSTGLTIQTSDFLLTQFADWGSPILRRLAGVETALTGQDFSAVRIEKPVFIAGLARSGTTILLELLSTIDGAATHRYRDFPFVLTPLIWNGFLKRAAKPQPPVERAHQDRIQITAESPEAFEEPIWKAFFPDCHAVGGRQVLTAADTNVAFDRFFQEHLKKILLLRSGARYISKGNYNVTRIEYLGRLFPDARFIVPIRHPFTHVHSLVRQHELFSKYAAADPRVPRYLAAVGHFEFGPQRLPLQVTPGTAQRILAAWSAGDDYLGYAIQWTEIYGYVDRLRHDRPELAQRVLVVRYEDFCADPRGQVDRILAHIEVQPVQAQRVYSQLSGISQSEHAPSLAEAVVQRLAEQVRDVAARFGYDVSRRP